MNTNAPTVSTKWQLLTQVGRPHETLATGAITSLNFIFSSDGAIVSFDEAGRPMQIDIIEVSIEDTAVTTLALDLFPLQQGNSVDTAKIAILKNGTVQTYGSDASPWTPYLGGHHRLSLPVPLYDATVPNTWNWELQKVERSAEAEGPAILGRTAPVPLKVKVKVTRIDPDKRRVVAPPK